MTVTNYVLPWCYIIMFYVGAIILFMHHLATTEPFVTTGSKSTGGDESIAGVTTCAPLGVPVLLNCEKSE